VDVKLTELLNFFYRLAVDMRDDPISSTFGIIIIFAFGLGLAWLNSSAPKRKAYVELTPQLLTSIGIIGTFSGIVIGLLDFDIYVADSIDKLLDGLKIAFGTSILGLGSSITFRLVRPLLSTKNTQEEIGAAEVLNELKSISQALIGDQENSLASELQKLRAQSADNSLATKEGFAYLGRKFDEFSETMSEAFSKAIIEELNSVIRDFNEKLTEQFGDNFKQLNAAVEKLVQWQENYRQQMDKLETSLNLAVSGIDASKESIGKIEKATEAIPGYLEKLPDIYDRFKTEFDGLEQAMSAFAETKDKASDAFPQIERNVLNLTDNFRKASDEQGRLQQEMLDGLQRSFNETVTNANNAMSDAMGQLDKSIQEEIERVVNIMSTNLSGITQQFVSDYQPLLEAHKNLIEATARPTDN
jgi:DNA anti-recombination protein RmuC